MSPLGGEDEARLIYLAVHRWYGWPGLRIRRGYITTVLAGAHVAHPVAPAAAESAGITLSDVLTGTGTAIGALILAFLALYWRRLPRLRRGYEPGAGLTAPIQRFQSGVINDYVTWMVLGLAVIGGVLALIIR